jgi:hypothetical protein
MPCQGVLTRCNTLAGTQQREARRTTGVVAKDSRWLPSRRDRKALMALGCRAIKGIVSVDDRPRVNAAAGALSAHTRWGHDGGVVALRLRRSPGAAPRTALAARPYRQRRSFAGSRRTTTEVAHRCRWRSGARASARWVGCGNAGRAARRGRRGGSQRARHQPLTDVGRSRPVVDRRHLAVPRRPAVTPPRRHERGWGAPGRVGYAR